MISQAVILYLSLLLNFISENSFFLQLALFMENQIIKFIFKLLRFNVLKKDYFEINFSLSKINHLLFFRTQNASRGVGGATDDARRGKESQMTSQQLQMSGGGTGGGAGGAGGPGQPGYQLRQTRGQSSKPREGMATGMFISTIFMGSVASLLPHSNRENFIILGIHFVYILVLFLCFYSYYIPEKIMFLNINKIKNFRLSSNIKIRLKTFVV